MGLAGGEREFAVLVKGDASKRIQEDRSFQLGCEWRMFFDLDERVGDHHVAHSFVRGRGSGFVETGVLCVSGRIDSSEQIARVDDEGASTNLTETERRLGDGTVSIVATWKA